LERDGHLIGLVRLDFCDPALPAADIDAEVRIFDAGFNNNAVSEFQICGRNFKGRTSFLRMSDSFAHTATIAS